MPKVIFLLLLFIHGLIHLMGFAKAFKFAEITQFTQSISKPVGAFWGLSTLLFVLVGVLFILKKDTWWIWAMAAVFISQVLIFTSWQDAKFGTLANLLVVIFIVIGYGSWRHNKLVSSELEMFLAQNSVRQGMLTEEKIATLPTIVQTWLRRSNVVDKPVISSVHLWQKGEMRTSPVRRWMPFDAQQYFTLSPPGFIWLANVEMKPFFRLVGRDKFVTGKGEMLIKAMSILPLVNAKGPGIDQGSMVRYLSEIIWFPQAAIESYISWEEIDSTSAKATMNYGGITVDGTFQFTPAGDLQSFQADRFYDRKGMSTLEPWHIESKDWAVFDGVRMPVISEVTWKLKEGDFTWLKVEVTEVHHDESHSK